MQAKDRKLPKVGAKRFGHRSHVKGIGMVKVLAKGGYFDKKIAKEKERYANK
jgi:hypothetical protein